MSVTEWPEQDRCEGAAPPGDEGPGLPEPVPEVGADPLPPIGAEAPLAEIEDHVADMLLALRDLRLSGDQVEALRGHALGILASAGRCRQSWPQVGPMASAQAERGDGEAANEPAGGLSWPFRDGDGDPDGDPHPGSPRWLSLLRASSTHGSWPWIFALAVAALTGPAARGQEPKASPPAATAGAPVARAMPAGPLSGAQLYTHYCAACHGETGDGNGPAAKFLYPKPRNFRENAFRMVTTANLVPSDEDLMRTLDRGMPGSAMFPFAHLPERDRRLLVAHVRQLVRQGLEAKFRKRAAEDGEEVDPDELATLLEDATKPGERLAVPDLPPPAPESLARGRAEYLKVCAACHGETGRGDGAQEQKDETGLVIRPRDFTRGIFKGGAEPDQVYTRIVLGVPGTPMPSSPALKTGEAGDLVNYVLSLSGPKRSGGVDHKRSRLTARRVRGPLPEAIPAAIWSAAPAVPIVVSPLWWREGDPGLTVQAIHDGKTLAIRLKWSDPTPDDAAVRVHEFPDMAAVQLFKGPREPFLGMGGDGGAVDLWLWNSAAQADLAGYRDVDTSHPHLAVDHYPFARESDGPRRHPTEWQPRQFLSAWAAGNLRSDPTQPLAASHLQARGFGSLTLRPRADQHVTARGHRSGEGWEVVLRRPLTIPSGAGLALAPGDRVSIAFALWDGSFKDRAGQKLVSIWHDLDLE